MAGTRAYIKYLERIEKDRQRKLREQRIQQQAAASVAAAAAAAAEAAAAAQAVQIQQAQLLLNSTSSSSSAAPQIVWDDNAAALVIGIEYTRYAAAGRMERLPGCHHDVETVKALLKDVYKVSPSFTKVLVDIIPNSSTSNQFSVAVGTTSMTLPSAENIRRAIAWLLQTNKKNLFFFYSGHGSYLQDNSSDEIDGRDEVLVPDDYLTAGYITDDYLHEKLVKPATAASARLTCVFDCCHAGSMLDLGYFYSTQDNATKQHRASLRSTTSSSSSVSGSNTDDRKKGAAASVVVSISACADSQTSVSASNMDDRRQWQGALTFAFDKAVRDAVGDGTISSALGLYPLIDGKRLIVKIGSIISSKGFSQITTLSTDNPDPSARIYVPVQ